MTTNHPALHNQGLYPTYLDRRTGRAMVRQERQSALARHSDQLRIGRIADAASQAQATAAFLCALELAHSEGSRNQLTDARLMQITDAAVLALRNVVVESGR